MADNTTLNTGVGGDVIGTDDIGGVKFQRVKLIVGADGTNDGDVASGNPMPISAASLPLPTGAATAANQAPAYTEDAASVANPIGIQVVARRRDALAGETTTDGDVVAINSTDKGELYIKHVDNVNIGTMPNVVIGAGANAIGKLAANSGIDIGDVDVTSLPALPAGGNNIGDVGAIQSGTWTVQPGNTPNATPWLIAEATRTVGGPTTYHLSSAATTNAVVVKASAGQLYGWYVSNNASAIRKLAFHNLATVPTAGAALYFAMIIPPGSGANAFIPHGIPFATGIAITTVTGAADTNTTAVSLDDMNINLWYA
jgi:hypothetical protein